MPVSTFPCLPVWSFRAFTDIHDVFAALIAAGKPLPEGVTPRLVAAVNRIATKVG
jgi:hypothetical protein